ncbi:co-chaperone DjlA [Testudinibacter sp. TR-2022]|uniref:co-chaperone DjlA n=1 Tax=Testudinibacter sp. TR-2022 TaxID=2585029 RepID=UPI0011196DFB|nr:co-chaperone DjlA [Testudinibacter sp. TR-2022]TNH04108.1 co-chaperone DjlA [Pasteurellaceae bacterium Phil31]TNH09044.1 co-chaperone DjlA [Testudinibacter sp. TR-2022]TNH12881.1 co-chaperone DjlA [Testudinibacter sp. TR-2022]TNH13097.1 co-chaperone DjlA [Testudinibacter sp. TR-2022]TNH14857.1 co-chaperone DjlA [Testudinibacter sp. TR-2022]
MNFIGKIIGFILGYRYGGFWGAIFGAVLGHFVDKKIYEMGSVSSSFFSKTLTRQQLFLQTTFAVMGHLSKAKGRVTQEDIQLAQAFMSRLNLDSAAQRMAQDAFSRGKDADFPIRQVIREFRVACGRRPDLLRMFLDIQIQTALADNHLDQNEKSLLSVIAQELGLSQMQFEQMMAMIYASQQFASGAQYQQQGGQYQQQGGYQGGQSYRTSAADNLQAAYQVLGVAADDEQLNVKRAYRKLMNEYHPDKLVAKGLPPEMMEMAKEKAQKIQAAYDLICKSKGWK